MGQEVLVLGIQKIRKIVLMVVAATNFIVPTKKNVFQAPINATTKTTVVISKMKLISCVKNIAK